MKSYILGISLPLSILFSGLLKGEHYFTQEMSVEEALKLIDGKELDTSHEIWRHSRVMRMFPVVNPERIRFFHVESSSENIFHYEYYELLEWDENEKIKNLYKLSPYTEYTLDVDSFGTFAEIYNSIKKGDYYDDVVEKIGHDPYIDFFCREGVWYIKANYYIDGKKYPIEFFAATGKVARTHKIDLKYARSLEAKNPVKWLENGTIEVDLE